MKIIIEKSKLLEAILPSTGFASKKNTIAAVEGILFDAKNDNTCEICAFDLEKGMKTILDCTVEREGKYIINASRLIQIIRIMPDGDISIEIDTKSLRCIIIGGRAKFELQALNGEDFPDLPEIKGEKGITMKQSDLKKMIQKTQFAISVNHIRPELRGLNFSIKGNTITAISCDGNRISFYSKTCDIENVGSSDLDFNIIIHGDTITELSKFISDSDELLTLKVARKHAIFFIGKFVIFTRLIDAQTTDYDRFIPKKPEIIVEVNTASFTSSLERSLLITEEHIQRQTKSPVICNFEGDVLSVSSSSVTGRVNDEFTVQHKGNDIEIGFNCRFLHDAMKVCDSENVRLSLTSPLTGMIIEPVEAEENTRFLMLVLPVRLNK